jgi:hypothetical protein
METEFIFTFITIGTFFLSIVGLFIWNRTESRSDMRHIENLLAAMNSQVGAIQQEMKDFHGRLERHDAEFKAHLLHLHDIKK